MLPIRKILLSAVFAASTLTTAETMAENSTKKFAIDAAHSSVNFSVSHMGYAEMTGRFNKLSGNVEVTQSGIATINIDIDSASVDTNHEKRDTHLRSPDFFNAKQFPRITLNSDIDLTEKTKTLVGEVSMLGKTRTVNFLVEKGKEGKDPWGLHRIGYTAQATIKRSDFGMNFMQGGIGDDIVVNVNIEAVQQ